MPETEISKMVPLWILEDDVDPRLLPCAGVARLDGRSCVSIDELMSDMLSHLRSNSPAFDAMKVYLSSGELSLADLCLQMISDPQQRVAAAEDLRQTEASLLKEYEANLASIKSEIDAIRAKGLPGYEFLRSQPFLHDAERHAADRRLGRALESLEQCFDFVIKMDDMMVRWAAEFEQLWDQAQRIFSAMPYSPAVDSIEFAATIFSQCRQWHDVHHTHPTQACIDELKKLVQQLEEISAGKVPSILQPSTPSPAKPEKIGPARGQFFPPTQKTHPGKDRMSPSTRLSSASIQLEAMLEGIDCSLEEETARGGTAFLKQLSVVLGLPENDEGLRPILNSVTSDRQRRTLAAWLLRFLCHCSPAVENDRDFRLRVSELFDTHLGPLYKALDLRSDQPNHEKLAKLRDAESELLAKFDAITRTIVSVQTAISIQNKFMQELRRPAHQIFLEEFVDSSLQSDERLRELFSAVKEYAESPPSVCVEAYHKLDDAFMSFFRDEAQVSTLISRQCLVTPLWAIHNIVREHFQHNDVVKPARVSISDMNRKYPLHVQGRRLDLKFLLNNDGPGHAFDVEVEIAPPSELEVTKPALSLGTLPVGTSVIIFEAKVIRDSAPENPCVVLRASWNNFGQRRSVDESIFEVVGQPADIDWDQLRIRQPYSLEHVETEDQLVGRGDVIKSLLNRLQAERIESSILFGQRRVGKTSIAKILQSKLQQIQNYMCIYIEIGALNTLTPEKFVNSLGSEVLDQLSMYVGFEKPSLVFEGSLAPLTSFMKTLHRTRPELRFVLILDEFDEVPSELYRYTPIASTFFQNLRSLSSEGYVGFVLIGGENMLLIQQSTDKLNKFDTARVDYFDKQKYWNDFRDLVRRPTANCLEYADDAVQALYEMTEGNPFYTKVICRPIFARACEDGNSYVSHEEVERAVIESLETQQANSVNHFWKDGIRVDDSARRDEIETQRRKFLLGFAEARRRLPKGVTRQDLNATDILKGEPGLNELIDSFISRGVLIQENDILRLKPRYFERWLIDRGGQLVSTSSIDERAIAALRKADEQAYVRDGELVSLCKPWGLYRGNRIQAAEVRNWLSQFEGNREQRLMFQLLQGLRFYTEAQIREKMTIIHRRVRSSLVYQVASGERKRKDLLLSSFGKPSKSASSYARVYAQENEVSIQNVAEFAEITRRISSDEKLKGIIFVDDIVASGQTTNDCLDGLYRECGELLASRGIRVFIGSICAFSMGIDAVEQHSRNLPFEIQLVSCDLLTETDRCFSESSGIFESKADRERAKEVALSYGKRLVKNNPLGYKGGELLVVFPDNCPNNSLPILWETGSGNFPWTSLFCRSF